MNGKIYLIVKCWNTCEDEDFLGYQTDEILAEEIVSELNSKIAPAYVNDYYYEVQTLNKLEGIIENAD